MIKRSTRSPEEVKVAAADSAAAAHPNLAVIARPIATEAEAEAVPLAHKCMVALMSAHVVQCPLQKQLVAVARTAAAAAEVTCGQVTGAATTAASITSRQGRTAIVARHQSLGRAVATATAAMEILPPAVARPPESMCAQAIGPVRIAEQTSSPPRPTASVARRPVLLQAVVAAKHSL